MRHILHPQVNRKPLFLNPLTQFKRCVIIISRIPIRICVATNLATSPNVSWKATKKAEEPRTARNILMKLGIRS